MTKEILYWATLAFYVGFLLKLMWRQLRDVWALAEVEQSAAPENLAYPPQWWWGSE